MVIEDFAFLDRAHPIEVCSARYAEASKSVTGAYAKEVGRIQEPIQAFGKVPRLGFL